MITSILKILAICSFILIVGCSVNSESEVISPKLNTKTTPLMTSEIMLSNDEGNTWTNHLNELPHDFKYNSILIAESNTYLGGTESSVFKKSTKNNSTWEKENIGDLQFRTPLKSVSLKYQFFETNSGIFANVMYNGIFMKANNSTAWQPIKKPSVSHVFNDIATHNGGILIASIDGLFKSIDSGKTWKNVYPSSYVSDIEIINNHLFISNSTGIYISKNDGEDWQKLPIIQTKSMTNLGETGTHTISSQGNQLIVLRDERPGTRGMKRKLQVSDDEGKTWQLIPADEYLSTLYGVSGIVEHNNFMYCGYVDGVMRSKDGGVTWEHILKATEIDNNSTYKVVVKNKKIYCFKSSMGC